MNGPADGYAIPAESVRTEDVILGSRFIATLAHAPTADAARAFLDQVRAEFPDATHHCWAFVAGPPGSTASIGMSDAGEPHGTAGRPMLDVLLHSGIGEIAVVVTRYFGGTKLGTGGLVRAYSEAVRQVVDGVPRAEKVLTHTVMLGFPYSYLERVRLLVSAQNGKVLDEDFATEVTLTARLAVEHLPAFQSSLSELTSGKVQAEIVETSEILMPLKK